MAQTAPVRRPAPSKRPARPRPATRAPAAAAPVVPDKAALKLVRDGFTMPQQDFDLIAVLKKRAVVLQRPAKKSELLRAGLRALQALPDKALLGALEALVPVKLGRPKKGG